MLSGEMSYDQFFEKTCGWKMLYIRRKKCARLRPAFYYFISIIMMNITYNIILFNIIECRKNDINAAIEIIRETTSNSHFSFAYLLSDI